MCLSYLSSFFDTVSSLIVKDILLWCIVQHFAPQTRTRDARQCHQVCVLVSIAVDHQGMDILLPLFHQYRCLSLASHWDTYSRFALGDSPGRPPATVR